MTVDLPSYDELYVISDIHMGGRPGFQILNQGPRLGKLIRHLSTLRPEDPVGLVLNGDVVDSLAEDINGYIAMDEAVTMMERIYGDPAFVPIWEALSDFVRTPNRHLIVVLGNHDLEMALPHVEFSMRRRLVEGNTEAQGRIQFATRGGGHACRVGSARVFCTHGNEVDDWNLVNYEHLAELGHAVNADRYVARDRWEPNAGTRLVVDVMNAVKRKHPFVDLLKPENRVVAPILVVLDPDTLKQVSRILPVVSERIRGRFRRSWLLSDEAIDLEDVTDVDAAAEIAMEELMGPSLGKAVRDAETDGLHAADLLGSIEKDVADGRTPAVAGDNNPAETLGWSGLLLERLRGVDKVEALRRALQDWLKDDDTFAIDTRDDTFEKVTQRVGQDVDFIVTGHTHLERAIQIDSGVDRFYYNCGTWIRLLRFTDRILSDSSNFESVFRSLGAGRLDELDAATIPGGDGERIPLVLNRSTVVRISTASDGVTGELFHVRDAGEEEIGLEPVAGSRFKRR